MSSFKRRSLALVATAFVGLGIAACGNDSPGSPTGIGEEASAVLLPQVEAVRASAAGSDRAGALEHLATFRQAVLALVEAGQLSEESASLITSRSLAVEGQLLLLPEPVPPTVQPVQNPQVDTQADVSVVEEEGDRKDDDDGGDGGKGNKGRGKDD